MFIVWGRRVNRKKIGYVADFCPMCREPQAFLLRSISAYRHVYYIPTTSSESLGFERICQGCKLALQGAPKYYKASSKKPVNVEDIVRTSFPTLREHYADRLRIEDALRKDPFALSNDLRYALVEQPFKILSPLVLLRRTSLDWVVAAALVAGFSLLFLAPTHIDTLHIDNQEAVFGVMGGAGLILFVGSMVTEPRRYIKRKIVPRIANTLAPVRPTEAEINAVRGRMRGAKQKIASLRASQLLKAIESAPSY